MQRGGDRRRGFGKGLCSRSKGGEEALGFVQERPQYGQIGVCGVERRGTLGDRFLDVGARYSGEGPEGLIEGDEEARVGVGHRGDGRGEVLERPPKAAEVGLGGDQVAQGRFTADEELLERTDRFV